MTQVTAEQALVFPDEVSLEEGMVLTDELLMQALPLESFRLGDSGEGAARMCWACCSGRRGGLDASRMRSCSPFSPCWRGAIWRASIAVQVGDVFTYKGCALALHPGAHHAGRLAAGQDPGPLAQGGDRRRRMKCASGQEVAYMGGRRGRYPDADGAAVHLYSGAHLAGGGPPRPPPRWGRGREGAAQIEAET